MAEKTEARLTVADLEFVPSRDYAAVHACGAVVVARGSEMRAALDSHTEVCDD